MRGYYIIFMALDEPENGIGKKIVTQVETLNKYGCETKLISFSERLNRINKIKFMFNINYYNKFLPDDFYKVDFYYIRHPKFSMPFYGLLRSIKKKGKGKVLDEIPTYPYDKEWLDSLYNIVRLCFDKIIRKKASKNIDRFGIFGNQKTVFGRNTIKLTNGIDCSKIPVRQNKTANDELNLIAVARFETWHGYDRLIAGLKNYYAGKPQKIVNVYLVGNGDEMPVYKKMAEEYGLSRYVILTGFLTGDMLTDVYNKADIAVCSLGCHRKNLFLSSELKSREYLARGFPMISSIEIDVLPDDFKYCLYVPEDETPVDIRSIIEFYNKLPERDAMIHDIRTFAEDNCDMSKTMLPVIEYLKK